MFFPEGADLNKFMVGCVIIFLSLVSLGSKFWADGKALSVEGPSFMRLTPEGNIGLRMGERIIVIAPSGQTVNRIDFKSLGFHVIGDFDYFSNGDLLIYNRVSNPSFAESILRFFRVKEKRQDNPQGNEGLYRCDSQGRGCNLFSAELPAFYSSFHLAIDRNNDDVYIADTPRFILYKLDEEGDLIASYESDLKFPNQIVFNDGQLYVANTNYHEIAVVKTQSDQFGQRVESHTVRIDTTHQWPSQLALVGEHWWVVVSDSAMKDGRIVRFDRQWNALPSSELSDNADPMGIVFFNNSVWLADWRAFKIDRFSASGEPQEAVYNAELDAILTMLPRV